MRNVLKFVAAVLLALLIGSTANMVIILLSEFAIAPPEGADMTTTKGVRDAMDRFEPRHFLMPFVAHTLGSFFGGFSAALMAPRRKIALALLVGGIFLVLGITMVALVGGPTWFVIVDMVTACLPPALLGGYLGARFRPENKEV